MPRTVNEKEFEAKRHEILDIAQHFIQTKGYNAMTVQDILNELDMSNGSFFHYFRTKLSLLEALIERIQKDVENHLLAIEMNPDLSALEKLRKLFDTLEHSRFTHQPMISELLKVWFDDDNALVREKVYDALAERRAPLFNRIIQQGVLEGDLTTPYPKQTTSIILTLSRGMGTELARQMLSYEQAEDKDAHIGNIVALYDAYTDAIERVLGAPPYFLDRTNPGQIKIWLGLNPNDNFEIEQSW